VKRLASVIVAGAFAAAAAPAAAQTSAVRAAAEQRYQIGQMERVLEGAVEHGLAVTRDRVQALAQAPADLLVSENAHARGFRLEGYGVFFDVIVPSFETTWTWSLRTLDQNDLGVESALRTLQTHVKTEKDPDLEQALKRIELQMGPAMLARNSAPAARGARNATGSAATVADGQDPIMNDPNEAYRTEVLQALKDAMLAHSSSLAIGPTEWLTIAAKGNDDRPRLAPADTASGTRMIRLRGSDLGEFLAGRITREEALKRIEERVF
jgi:ribosomal protein L12E/L44/L45/RPP1/RPP2